MLESIIATLIALIIVAILAEVRNFIRFDKGWYRLAEKPGIETTRWQLYKTYPFGTRVWRYIVWRVEGRI